MNLLRDRLLQTEIKNNTTAFSEGSHPFLSLLGRSFSLRETTEKVRLVFLLGRVLSIMNL